MTTAPSCSRSHPVSGTHWPGWLSRAPALVAESLAPVRDPLAAWLAPPPAAPPLAVGAALARALLPPVARDEPPAWLRPDQRLSFQRALAAVRRFGGALLADGVGTGKTWISLAVASALEPKCPIHVLAPASLVAQWRQTARRIGLSILPHSHETLSRGRTPGAERGPVILDESHRFRTPETRRYQTVAPWLVGRQGLLLSATPAVNRLEDVAHQLLLLVRDDAMAWSGIGSLLNGLRAGSSACLAHLVVTGEDRSGALPVRTAREIRPEEAAGSVWHSMQEGILALRLSRDPVVASLIRVVLLQALASSPAAVAEALRKYRGLLLHAADASAVGARPSRQAIRRMVGADTDQLVLWPLVAEEAALPELAAEDLPRVEALERGARSWCLGPDCKVLALRAATEDQRPTLVFTTLTATVRHLRAHLGRRRVAWCTGSASGLDQARLPRDTVLDWFRKPPATPDRIGADSIDADSIHRPTILLATDVAAEGLDLPLMERVVHYDLPWTAVRLEQRSGRAIRLGTMNRAVEVIRFRPAPALEAALRKESILESKAALPGILGLSPDPSAPWRLRARIAAAWDGIEPREGTAQFVAPVAAVVAGFRIVSRDGSSREVVMARTSTGWSDDPAMIAGLLEQARDAVPESASGTRPDRPRPPGLPRGLSGIVRGALRLAHGAAMSGVARSPTARSVFRRVMTMARDAARRRDDHRLRLLDAALGFLRRGHTAGEARLVLDWSSLSEAELLRAVGARPRERPAAAVHRVELIGLLLMERRQGRG